MSRDPIDCEMSQCTLLDDSLSNGVILFTGVVSIVGSSVLTYPAQDRGTVMNTIQEKSTGGPVNYEQKIGCSLFRK